MTDSNEQIALQFTPAELQLMVKLVEANDSGMLDRRGRLGHLRTRTSLAHKLYEAKDSLLSDDTADAEEDET